MGGCGGGKGENMKNEIDEQFVVDLMDGTETHEQWLSVVRFGLNNLLDNQALLIEVVSREAARVAERDTRTTVVASDFIADIFAELGLRFVPVTTGN